MSWNYRVIRTEVSWSEETPHGSITEELYYEYNIHEVHYDLDKSILYYCEAEATAHGNTFAELSEDLELIREALSRPILEIIDGNLVEVTKEKKHEQ